MKFFFLVATFSLKLISCENSKPVNKKMMFNQFDFSYNDFFSTCFSIKFTQGDTVFIRQHWASAFSDSLKSNKNYRAILSDPERERLDSFLIKMKFATYDTSYYESYQDGHYYEFFINKDTLKKTIFVHSDSIPNELKDFGYWIVATKKKLRLVEIDTTLEFGSLKYFLPPSVPPPTIKFTPPKVK